MHASVYISGYTNNVSVGIYHYGFDTNTGILTPKGLAVESVNPSYFTTSNNHLFAVNEVPLYNGANTGYVSSYSRNKKTGELTLMNEQPSGGEDPCYAVCDVTGNFLLVANYNGGSAAVLPISDKDGELGAIVSNPFDSQWYNATGGVPDRQEKPHVHSIDLDPVGQRYAFTNDLGCDRLITYKFDRKKTGSLTRHSDFQFPIGSGPRHIKFAPNNNNFAYVISELSNDVFMLEFDFHKGKFNLVQKIHALPEDFQGENLGSEIDIPANGKFLYVSMRGYDVITIFKIDQATGKLKTVGYQNTGGKHPRHFTFDPTGSFLLVGNKDTDNVVVFKMDKHTGLLKQVSSVEHVQPTCVKFWA
ncbi:Lactonase, 7-bladed beta-propeller-domain-containing protein [Mucor mucedo]|uniref:Lactonase, 7-bladed beta-propeller-domain-containing protein n=1 Tax=Mucor mucedo TaxID=29922 RepID=UPI002220D01F|nr:Lactonase, 7-bladed beta-propeller-domain-containing protein [Mucor mucedo]KAI7890544.1 Lactonase, 7-bladed beta-propeller-domain-containing protein [Mucor mucedo]